ncbi:MAG: Endoplasmic reticulum zinc transporter [Alyxoria varia]|nr:MAG: Endoplasmic reticulum zinc transporter [Alyxoria varia]
MASDLPLPVPPRTPTPPSDDDRVSQSSPNNYNNGLGLSNAGIPPDQNPNRLSAASLGLSPLTPMTSVEPPRRSSAPSNSEMPTPAINLSPPSPNTQAQSLTQTPSLDSVSGDSAVDDSMDSQSSNPFGFQTVTYVPAKPKPVNPSDFLFDDFILLDENGNEIPTDDLTSQQAVNTIGQRRGHRYKHSSVSHQIFQEPKPRAPLRLPASLPIPTLKESYKSMTRDQTLRIAWCACHFLVAAYVQFTAQGSLALTALSHLIFYDAIGALLSASVDVLSNFEVWKRSSIRQPFGLERSEVLIGFAMSILLLFMGFDLISHAVAHGLDSAEISVHTAAAAAETNVTPDPKEVQGHIPHHSHKGHASRVSSTSITLVSILAFSSTLISAYMLQNHARMARAMRFASLKSLPSVFSNPSHLLTLSCSVLLFLLPLMEQEAYAYMDSVLSVGMALAMCTLGVQLVKALGAMLLMSYSGPPSLPTDPATAFFSKGLTSSNTANNIPFGPKKSDDRPATNGSAGTPHNHGDAHDATNTVTSVIRAIQLDPVVSSIEEAKFWQVHYGLCLANLKLRVNPMRGINGNGNSSANVASMSPVGLSSGPGTAMNTPSGGSVLSTPGMNGSAWNGSVNGTPKPGMNVTAGTAAEDSLMRLRERIGSLIRTRLAGGYGGMGGQKWEVSTELVVVGDY